VNKIRGSMTLKHHLQNHYNGFTNALTSFEMPAWISGLGMRVGLVGCIFVFGLLYLFQTGNTAAAGYQISNLEKSNAELSDEIRSLEVQVANYSSLVYVKERLPEFNMVAVASVKKLSPVSAVVALR